MKFPMVWRKAAEDETAVWKAEATRQRRRAEQAEKSLATQVAARRRATELYSDLFDEHERATASHTLLCAQVDEPGGLPVRSRRVLSEDELLEGWGAPVLVPGAVVATSFDDCVPCGKATAGVLHRNGWTCGECLTSVPAGGVS